MKIIKTIKTAAIHATGRKTKEEKEAERLEFIKELIKIKKKKPKNEAERIKFLQQDHYLDSITVLDKDGKVLIKTGDAGETEHLPRVYQKAREAFPETKMVVIKEGNGYNILYNKDGLLYVFKSPGEVSSLETKIIAEKLGGGKQ